MQLGQADERPRHGGEMLPRFHRRLDGEAGTQLRQQRIVGEAIFTGMRCTILVKLPVAFSGGSSANWAPVPGEKLSTLPRNS